MYYSLNSLKGGGLDYSSYRVLGLRVFNLLTLQILKMFSVITKAGREALATP